MRTIYLHIGMHKTGSTAIQSAFNGYKDQNIRYANLGYENHSIPIYTAFSGAHRSYHIWQREGLNNEEIDKKRVQFISRIRAWHTESKNADAIISGEDISLLPENGVEDLHQLLTSDGSVVKILAYVRDPSSFISSDLQELIKSEVSFDRPQQPNFRERLEKFIRIFGRDSVTIRNFDRDTLLKGDIVSDFSEFVGCPVPRMPRRSNESLSTDATRAVYILNRTVSSFGASASVVNARREFISRMRNIFPGRFELPPELISNEINLEDVRWLSSVSGIDYNISENVSEVSDGETSIDSFLGSLSDVGKSRIRSSLTEEFGVRKFPMTDDGLISRYFMALLEPSFSIGRFFRAERYLTLNPDVAAAGANPYCHFLLHGLKEGRRFF